MCTIPSSDSTMVTTIFGVGAVSCSCVFGPRIYRPLVSRAVTRASFAFCSDQRTVRGHAKTGSPAPNILQKSCLVVLAEAHRRRNAEIVRERSSQPRTCRFGPCRSTQQPTNLVLAYLYRERSTVLSLKGHRSVKTHSTFCRRPALPDAQVKARSRLDYALNVIPASPHL